MDKRKKKKKAVMGDRGGWDKQAERRPSEGSEPFCIRQCWPGVIMRSSKPMKRAALAVSPKVDHGLRVTAARP